MFKLLKYYSNNMHVNGQTDTGEHQLDQVYPSHGLLAAHNVLGTVAIHLAQEHDKLLCNDM